MHEYNMKTRLDNMYSKSKPAQQAPKLSDELKDSTGAIKKFSQREQPRNIKRTDNTAITNYLETAKTRFFLHTTLKQTPGDNLSRAERLALKSLAENKDIVINKADKGSTIVIQDLVDYVKDGETHLSDTDTYQLLTEDKT